MDIGIIGCGLIGQRRTASIVKDDKDRVVVACDLNEIAARKVAGATGEATTAVTTDWREVVGRTDIGCVVIATVHSALAEIARAALDAGQHVLVEKPAARTGRELAEVVGRYRELREQRGLCCKVGFNHRFHPAVWHAKEIVTSGAIGEMMFIRGRYGHGGRVGYDKEWRAISALSGGGELLDQGMHLIDLSRWFLGDFTKVQGTVKTYFWDMEVDDNAFMTLETATGQVAQLQVSWTEWKNLFSLEIYGRGGKLHIEGLGGSYGVERLAHYQMQPRMGPPDTIIYEYPGADVSWDAEWRNFRAAIDSGAAPIGDLFDAYQAHLIVDQIYRENRHDYR